MKFETVQEAFNYYNQRPELIEERSQAIKKEIDTNPEADIKVLNVEVEGMKQAQENHEAKAEMRGNIMNFNPITGTKDIEKEEVVNDVYGTPEYRSAFYKDLLGKELSPTEQRAMDLANETTRIEKRAFNAVTDNLNVIPTQTLNEVVRRARTQGGLLSEVRTFHIPANLKIPVGTPANKAQWHTEGEEVTPEKAITTAVEFKAHELMKVFSISASAKKMSISAFEQYVTDELVASVMETLEQTLISGTGEGQGTGLETAINLVEGVNHLSYTVDETPEYTDFTKLVALLKRGYSQGAKFAMNSATLYNKVYSIVDLNNRPIFITDPKAESIGKILGFDVIIDDNIADGDIWLGNFSKYLGVNIPDGIALEVSTQSSFNKGLIDYRALAIADTQVILPEAFVKLSEGEL